MFQTNARTKKYKNTLVQILFVPRIDKAVAEIQPYGKPEKYKITVALNGQKNYNIKNSILHELTHFMFMYLNGQASNHTEHFYRVLKFLEKEFDCEE